MREKYYIAALYLEPGILNIMKNIRQRYRWHTNEKVNPIDKSADTTTYQINVARIRKSPNKQSMRAFSFMCAFTETSMHAFIYKCMMYTILRQNRGISNTLAVTQLYRL